MLKAAISYLDSEYYQTARGLFQKVTKIDRQDTAAKFLYLYTSAFNCYFRNRFSMAQIFAEEALARCPWMANRTCKSTWDPSGISFPTS